MANMNKHELVEQIGQIQDIIRPIIEELVLH